MSEQTNPAVAKRDEILKREGLELVSVFDTNEHEPHKDVVLVEDEMGRRLVLRIGEHRTPGFLHQGYIGDHFVVPGLVKMVTETQVPYEIEEYLPGRLLFETVPTPTAAQLFPDVIVRKLVQAHWEFQDVARGFRVLEPSWHKQRDLVKFYEKALRYLPRGTKARINAIVNDDVRNDFWQSEYPCKWKYSADNLILMPDGKLGFIDLVKVSKRYWGYDLGWVFWPRWHHFHDEEFGEAAEHFVHLRSFFRLVFEEAPEREKKDRILFFTRCWLIVFERCLGALYDMAIQTGHIKTNIGTGRRAEAYTKFVQNILQLTLEELKNH